MSISLASQKCVYLLSLEKSLGLDLGSPILLQDDNHGAINLAQNPITHTVEADTSTSDITLYGTLWSGKSFSYDIYQRNRTLQIISLKPLAAPSSINSDVTSFANQYSIIEGVC